MSTPPQCLHRLCAGRNLNRRRTLCAKGPRSISIPKSFEIALLEITRLMSSERPEQRATRGTFATVGRPRDTRADVAILRSARELTGRVGVRDLRMDDVARRAGVSKATIYRRYSSKDELVTAVVASMVSEIVVPDTGSTRPDPALPDVGRGQAVYGTGRAWASCRAWLKPWRAVPTLRGPSGMAF